MKITSFWKPIIASLVAAPICLFLAAVSTGAGHGTYLWAKILFPYTMLSTLIFDSITAPFILLAIIQYPLYGIALGIAGKKRRFSHMVIALLILHLLAVVVFILFPNRSFGQT
jgi:hypothetical protein